MLKLAIYLKKFKKETIIGPIFKLLEAIFELSIPIVMALIIDVGIKNGDSTYIILMGGLMILLGLTGLGFALICQYCAAKASQGFGTVLRNTIFEHVGKFSYAQLDKLSTSSLVTRITGDANQLQLAVAMLIRLVVRAPFIAIGSMIMAFAIDAKLSIIFLISMPIIALLLYVIMSKSIPFYKGIQKLIDRLTLITRENLTSVRLIRALNAQERETKRFEEANDNIYRSTTFIGRISSLLNPLTTLVLNVAIIAIIYFGGIEVNSGNLTQGEIVALINYMTQILLALIVVANLVVIFTRAATSASRVNEILEIVPEKTTSDTDATFSNDYDNIVEFKNVSFSYDTSDKNALKNINFAIKKGETIGIIGATGCGKTTLISLIPAFYNATKGDVLIKGINVKNISASQLSKIVGVVAQHKSALSGTIKDNIVMSRQNISDADILKALEISQAKEYVQKFDDGLSHRVEQGGKNLSGGQMQRLTIARAIVTNPEIVILDDSSSALDYATDLKLRRALKEELDCVSIVVSQRVNAIKDADKILVLEEGELIDMGKHAQLFNRCDVYNEICTSQLSADELDSILSKAGANNE